MLKIAFLLAILSPTAAGADLKNEAFYNIEICKALGGESGVRLDDGTQVDCLTQEYAIEFDWAYKWHEAIGQSQFYAQKTGKLAAVVLLFKDPEDERFITRLNTALAYSCTRLRIWTVNTWEY